MRPSPPLKEGAWWERCWRGGRVERMTRTRCWREGIGQTRPSLSGTRSRALSVVVVVMKRTLSLMLLRGARAAARHQASSSARRWEARKEEWGILRMAGHPWRRAPAVARMGQTWDRTQGRRSSRELRVAAWCWYRVLMGLCLSRRGQIARAKTPKGVFTAAKNRRAPAEAFSVSTGWGAEDDEAAPSGALRGRVGGGARVGAGPVAPGQRDSGHYTSGMDRSTCEGWRVGD